MFFANSFNSIRRVQKIKILLIECGVGTTCWSVWKVYCTVEASLIILTQSRFFAVKKKLPDFLCFTVSIREFLASTALKSNNTKKIGRPSDNFSS
jgi:hypothetical protein